MSSFMARYSAQTYALLRIVSGFLFLWHRGELAALNCFVFLFISAQGAGIWSLDARRSSS